MGQPATTVANDDQRSSSDDYKYWKETLAGRRHPMTETPSPGFYRVGFGEHEGQPVAIWRELNRTVMLCGERIIDAAAAQSEIWINCAKGAIREEAYDFRMATGKWGDEVRTASEAAPASNMPTDPLERAKVDIAGLVERADELLRKGELKDQTTADTAANIRDRLLALAKEADELRKAEKRPHDEAARQVQAKYVPTVEEAEKGAFRLRSALEVFLRQQKEAERLRVAEVARIRRQEEEAARKLAPDNVAAAEHVITQPPPEENKIRVGGAYGKRTSLKEKTVVRIDDRAAALSALKDHPLIIEALQKAAELMIKAKLTVPGVSTYTEDKL